MAAIIFDFDGTITDSFNYVADFLAEEAGLPPLNSVRKHQLRGLSMAEMARQLGCHWWQWPQLFFRGRRQMEKAVRRFKPFDGMSEIIHKLHGEGHELFIVSNNTTRNIRLFLHAHHLHNYFLQVYGGVNLFGKAPVLHRLIRDHRLDAANCVYVGDEVRDVEAAQAAGMRAVAVSWGYAKEAELNAAHPTVIADRPADLIKILEEI
jgi:phosphoglycolate phosphatase